MIPVARNVWQRVEGGRSVATACRLIVANTRRRDSAVVTAPRPSALPPRGSGNMKRTPHHSSSKRSRIKIEPETEGEIRARRRVTVVPSCVQDRSSEPCGQGKESIAHTGRSSDVAANPSVTAGERPSRQKGDRPCAGLRRRHTPNRASGQSSRLPSELFAPRPARAATGADDDPASRSRPAHNSSRSDAQPFPPQSRARLPRYAHARRRACTSLGLLLVGIRQEHPRLSNSKCATLQTILMRDVCSRRVPSY